MLREEVETSPEGTSQPVDGKPNYGRLWVEQTEKLHQLLEEHHEAFSLEPNERGETDLLTMQIDTGDAAAKKQAVCMMPFAARSKVARQLHDMQEVGVVKPSHSPWASPVAMVQSVTEHTDSLWTIAN